MTISWIETQGSYTGFAGNQPIAEITNLDTCYGWSVHLGLRRDDSNSGVEETLELAKHATEQAFLKWKSKCNLVDTELLSQATVFLKEISKISNIDLDDTRLTFRDRTTKKAKYEISIREILNRTNNILNNEEKE